VILPPLVFPGVRYVVFLTSPNFTCDKLTVAKSEVAFLFFIIKSDFTDFFHTCKCIFGGGYATWHVSSGLYYKHMMIINDDSGIVNRLEASLTDDARVIIYDCHMFIVQATGKRVGYRCWQI
jgi:hypothetical protein